MAGTDFTDESDTSAGINSINITPFVDVVLVLLVIFIVTAPMLIKDIIELRLPKTSTGDGKMSETLGVAINRNGHILLNGQLIDEDELKRRALELQTRNPEGQAIIAADVDVAYGKVVRVIDLLKQAGLKKFAVQIEKDAKKESLPQ